jgi:hypothetical protein
VFEFLKIQFQLGSIDAARLQAAANKGYITQEQYAEIIGE